MEAVAEKTESQENKEESVKKVETESKGEEGSTVEGEGAPATGEAAAAKKKKKKKKKKKNNNNSNNAGAEGGEGGAAKAGGGGGGGGGASEEAKAFQYADAVRSKQTYPPSVPVCDLWPGHVYEEGQIHQYQDNNLWRTTSAETRERDRILNDEWNMMREAAECHRQVRRWAHTVLKPGINLYDFCEELEALNRKLVKATSLERGIAFPTGVSRNHIAAHYSPNPNDRNEILGPNDVLKIDFGTHVNGHIVDCAWTYTPNKVRYAKLLEAVQQATETGIREAGIDARLAEIGAAIQETMESYEIELDGKVYPIKAISNLNGHSIAPYRIHAGKSVPIVKGSPAKHIMEEGEHYAIETFGSTGKGKVVEDLDCSHYGKSFDVTFAPIRTKQAKSLLSHINKTYGTLPFCKRFLAYDKQEGFDAALSQLVKAGLVTAYPPLCDKPGCYTAQFEHTILLRPTCKEVVSRGDDY